ncbi:low temperature requirement protein A [Nocardia yamanashiensis]|uniref:low temperature requirement protein A n=1 Tax=Nocardia yamanashiensis TaxID=209247 RepID=UPI000B1DD98F|nr:low temperature requirement protein A [Nocardia yamanashiensis]
MLDPLTAASAESAPPRRATWFELFGDLVFVAAVGQIMHRVGAHPDAGAVAAAAGLFVPLWWAWVLYAVHANRADRDNTAHRLLTTAGLTGVVGMAVFAGTVGHDTAMDAGFVLSYLVARAGVAALYGWDTRRKPVLRPVFGVFASVSALTAVGWLGGLLLDAPWRYVVWSIAMVVELVLPLLAGPRLARVEQEPEHLRERFGLFTIIVLGEAVLGFTNGLVEARTAGWAVVTGAAAFALTAGLWWSYFNASSTRAGAHTQLARGGRLLNIYVFGHLPVQLGLALTGASMSIAVVGGGSHLNATSAACIIGGVALYLLAVAAVRAAFTGLRERVVLIRFATAALVLALLPVAVHVPVAALLTALAALMAVSAVAETSAHRRRMRSAAK